ncbi:endonuclease/exonuclease/phosphatase family protein [Aliiglaciecola sp. LCG003]|uniref:endonuclease/exonuclease/phosphatase family protein n=1 Tax=Aliiglaciecola sp. LCG003 TaxID=3053655 RepID=UPI0025746CAE|nr:endonuclease/exonuclease/phosphatase family protein [Aliiglaciecola sp. LCG003]WJG08808.1 endonuclease/exonuclease/phosphatase family protein [Aliiglaciecola sp. LCG003]
MKKYLLISLGLLITMTSSQAETIRVATFNVSMEAGNYVETGQTLDPLALTKQLASGKHQQIKNIAQIIQRVRPDILLLNEFDYIPDANKGVLAFIRNYLNVSQGEAQAIDYRYYYTAAVNTGVPSGQDLNHDAKVESAGQDAFGYGQYPGQYGMLLLSKFPIDDKQVRTFLYFLWKDMPEGLLPSIKAADGTPWYSEAAKQVMRLSSKSHWDVPININGQVLHILASHPTPPVFDGPENRNGKRNHDEIRFWVDYLSAAKRAEYIYDDQGKRGGFRGSRFVLLGDLNASEHEGDRFGSSIKALLQHSAVAQYSMPVNQSGQLLRPENPFASLHTAQWGLQVDYVLPSKAGLKAVDAGIFWPGTNSADYNLIKDRQSSSDHRLVWADVKVLE